MDMDSDIDFISKIPQSIIEIILTKLPIRDSVKTSILSSCWRYKWASLTDLVFDNRSLSTNGNRALDHEKLVNFITRWLVLHEGPIRKFSVSGFLDISLNIDQWLLFISQKGIKELTIDLSLVESFRVPYNIFSCFGLTHLELSGCELELHPDFKGFPCLKCLDLHDVSITPNDIDFLISSCPLLESFTLSFHSLGLTVRAPNLKRLILKGVFADLCLGNMPLLVDISFASFKTYDIIGYLVEISSCTFKNLFGGVLYPDKLTGHLHFTESTPCRFVLSMKDLDLDVWGKDCTFCRLRTIDMTEFTGSPNEMKFVNFLLNSSPSLEMMRIFPIWRKLERLRLHNIILDQLLRFCRASPRASIFYLVKPE